MSQTYIIYKIYCEDCPDYVYIGSTLNFRRRKNEHKSRCLNENSPHHHYKLYVKIRENGGWNNWIMMPIEEYKCDTKLQSKIREQEWIDKIGNLNIQNSYTNRKEYMKQYNKEYYHKDIINQRQRVNDYSKEKIICECGAKICRGAYRNHKKTQRHLDLLNQLE